MESWLTTDHFFWGDLVSHLPCQEYNGNSKIDVVDVELELLRIVIQQRNVLKHELEIDTIQLQEVFSP